MTGTLYVTNSDNRKLNKSLSKIKDITFKLVETCNFDNPTFIFERDQQDEILKSNYFYVDQWERYFYLESPTIIDFNRVLFTGRVDLLMTTKAELLETIQTITRSSDPVVYNSKLEDNLFQAQSNPQVQQKILKVDKFNTRNNPSSDVTLNYVLTTVKGRTYVPPAEEATE